jgi:hypothetical protein
VGHWDGDTLEVTIAFQQFRAAVEVCSLDPGVSECIPG